MYNILITMQEIGILLAILGMLYVVRQKPSPLQKDLILMNFSIVIALSAYTIEMQATELSTAVAVLKLSYIGRAVVFIAMFNLAIDFTHIMVKPAFRASMSMIQLVFMVLVLIFDRHWLFYKSVRFVDEGMFPHLVKESGPLHTLYIVNLLFYSAFLLVVLIRRFIMVKNFKDKWITLILTVIMILPFIGYALYSANLTGGYNGMMLGYVIGMILLTLIYRRYNIFETVDMAFEYVFRFIKAGLLVYDKHGNLIYENQMAKEMRIASRADELCVSREYFFHEDHVYRVEKLPITKGDEQIGYAYYIDNETDNYNYANKLKEEKKRSDEANEAKTHFLASMSHDIRTPMNAILGLTDIARLHIDDTDKVKDCLQKINTSGKHLIELINEVLDINKIESGKFELMEDDYDIKDLMDEIEVMSRPLVEAREHTLSIDTDEVKHSWISGDKSRFSQVIMNLVSNAVKYTNNGGLIILKIAETECDGDNVFYRIIVRDNGIGMSEEFLPTLFEPFTRAKDDKVYKTQGSGLGMSITKQFIELMGGTIEVRSTLSVGTTFEINIPMKIADESTRKDSSVKISDFASLDYAGKRVLVVEDNAVNAEIMCEFLSMARINVETASDGLEALEKFKKSESGYYDIIFMDVQMPRMNGYEATRNIRALDDLYAKTVPIIAVTGNAFSEDIREALNAGMNTHITKPVVYNKLLEVLAFYCK